MLVVLSIVYYGFKTAMQARGVSRPTDKETPFEPLPGQATVR